MRLTFATCALTLVLALTGCGDDDDSSATTTATAATTVATTAAASTAGATSAAPTTTRPATTSAGAATQPTTVAPTTTVDIGTIAIDADHDAVRTVTVPLGTPITLTVRSAKPQEFHLHGYDLELAGTEVVFQFTADLPGAFELESHATEKVILVLQVV